MVNCQQVGLVGRWSNRKLWPPLFLSESLFSYEKKSDVISTDVCSTGAVYCERDSFYEASYGVAYPEPYGQSDEYAGAYANSYGRSYSGSNVYPNEGSNGAANE